jgi:YVTN family beta-propeller protein
VALVHRLKGKIPAVEEIAMTAVYRLLRYGLFALLLAPLPAHAGPARVYVTNSAGDSIHVIDPTTNKVVQVISGIEAVHGISFATDGSKVYVSTESTNTLDVFDRERGKLIKKIELSARPNNIAVSKDGARIFVAIRPDPGAVDVIDAATLTRAKSIPVHGSLHNIYVTPDGKYLIAGSISKKLLTVIDLSTDSIAWEHQFDKGVRPMAIETNPDGSTKRIFVQLSDTDGFAVIDFAKREEVARITLPDRHTGIELTRGRGGWTLSRHRRVARRKNAVGHEHSAECDIRLFAARPEVGRRGRSSRGEVAWALAWRRGSQLGDVRARQQDGLRIQCRATLGNGRRRSGHEGAGRHTRW